MLAIRLAFRTWGFSWSQSSPSKSTQKELVGRVARLLCEYLFPRHLFARHPAYDALGVL
jgi:hypothetical protein